MAKKASVKKAAAKPPDRLIGESLAELLGVLGSVDSTELKMTVPDENRRSTLTALGLDPLEAQIRQVYFFDTPGLDLEKAGVVVRGRRVQGRGDDSVVKLRPVVPDQLPDDLRASPSFLIEVDVLPGSYVVSGSMRARHKGSRVKEAVAGEKPLSSVFTKEQRAFFSEHAPAGIELDDLTPLGPVVVLKLRFEQPGFSNSFVAELWNYPDGSRILELSTKCPPPEALQVGIQARAHLEGLGIDLSGAQQTKTRTALELFASEAAAAS